MLWSKKFSIILSHSTTPIQALGHLQATLLHSILGNYSITSSDARHPNFCENGKLRDGFVKGMKLVNPVGIIGSTFLPKENEHEYAYPLVLGWDFERLRFISCGTSPNSGTLPYKELINVFLQRNLWLSVIVAVFVVSASLHYFGPPTLARFGTETFFASAMTLVEQGAYSRCIMNHKVGRWIAGAYILISIVLSNAYKYKNVYNMILPLKPSPYETLRQLLEDNINVYTRAETSSGFSDFVLSFNFKRLNFTTTEAHLSPHSVSIVDCGSRSTAYTPSEVSINLEFYRRTAASDSFIH